MKRFLRILIPVLIISVGLFGGIFLYTHTGISDYVENRRASDAEKDVVAKIDGETLSENECRAYLVSMKNNIESIYSDKIWDYELDDAGTSYGQAMKDKLLERLICLKLVCANAKDFGVELSAEDKVDINSYVTAFFAGISEETSNEYGLTTELVNKIYSENVLAAKVYDKLTLSVDVKADKNNCRQGDFLRMAFKKYYIDEKGEAVYYTGNELLKVKQQAENAYQKVTERVEPGSVTALASFRLIAQNACPEDEAEVTVGADALDSVTAAKVMSLSDGEMSELIESENEYSVYYCVSSYNEEATLAAIQKKVSDERESYFTELYESWYQNADISVDTDKWAKLEIKHI